MASAKNIPPGGEGQIEVTLNTGSYMNRVSKTVMVYSNDPLQSTVRLTVSAEVTVQFALEPTAVNFGQMGSGQTFSRYLNVIGSEKDQVKILDANSTGGNIEVEHNPDGFENQPDQRVKITVKPGSAMGRFRETVLITTDHPLVNRIQVSVYGEVLGNISVFPNRLHFVSQEGQPVHERMLVVKATAADYTFHVLDVQAGLEDLTHEIITIQEGREYQVKIGFRESFDRQYWRGNIVIITDDQQQERIPVSVTVRAQRIRADRPTNQPVKKTDTTDR